MKETIQKMANLWWNEFTKDDNDSDYGTAFKLILDNEFDELKFTYSVQSNEWILLTDC